MPAPGQIPQQPAPPATGFAGPAGPQDYADPELMLPLRITGLDAGEYDGGPAPAIASFPRKFRWVEHARRGVPMAPELFDEDTDALARRIMALDMEIAGLKQMMQAIISSDLTRADLFALVQTGIDAGTYDPAVVPANDPTIEDGGTF